LAKACLRAKYHLDPSSRLATINIGRKLGEGAPSHFWGGERGPHLTQSRLGRGLNTKWHLSPCMQSFGDRTPSRLHGRRYSPWREGASLRSPSNTFGQGRGLPACQVSSRSGQLFGHNTPTSGVAKGGRRGGRPPPPKASCVIFCTLYFLHRRHYF